MKCPNDKEIDLIEFKNPLMVPPTEDAQALLDDPLMVGQSAEGEENNKCFYQLIHRACPICGYFEVSEITEEQFKQKFTQKEV